MTDILTLRDVRGGYGDADILNGITLTLDIGEIMVIAGPNGSGKSTLAKAIMGLLPRCTGTLMYRGRNLVALPCEDRATLGISYVPQVGNVFPSLTVLENLQVLETKGKSRQAIERMFEAYPALAASRRRRAGSLSGGERQQLALARALLTQPELMILDEPTANLAPALISDAFRRIAAMPRGGATVLLVEQRAREALSIATRGAILSGGQVVTVAEARCLLDDATLADRFLGAAP